MASRWVDYCLAKPGAWSDQPWSDTVVVKVGPKIFAFLGSLPHPEHRPTSLGLRCADREAADLWVERFPGSVTPLPYLARHGWNLVSLDGAVGDDDVAELIDDSYAYVVARLPRSQRP
jgi:predicted DNA-binding protein (MmcQ/YjbR family)